jgi:retinol dehydrogenase 12
LDRLDIVIENAGIATKEYRSTKDGWEETYVSIPPPALFPPNLPYPQSPSQASLPRLPMTNNSLQVNALSTFLLAFLLLPLLRKTTKLSTVNPRLVILSSGVHTWTDIPNYRDEENIFNAMNDKQKFVGKDRYPTSKLLDTLLTRELGERLENSSHAEDRKISLSGYVSHYPLTLSASHTQPLYRMRIQYSLYFVISFYIS